MSSYWDYLKRDITNPLTTGPAAFLHAAYDKAYDESHGSNRYWLSKAGPLAWNRKMRDSAQQAQDVYNNTGKDYAYSTRIGGVGPESVVGGIGSGVAAVGMARSLATLYSPEVIENVQSKFNGMYW